MANTLIPSKGLLPLPTSNNPSLELARLENSVTELLIKQAVQADLIKTKEDPSAEGRILGVVNETGASERLEVIAQNAKQWVSNGAAQEFFDQAKKGRAQFIELAQNNPEQAYSLVEQTQQLQQAKAMGDMQGALSFRQSLGELPSEQERLAADKKVLGSISSYSANLDSSALQRGLPGGEKAFALNAELRHKMASFEAANFALVDLESLEGLAPQLAQLGDKLTKDQLTSVTQAAAPSLLALVQTLPEHQDAAFQYAEQSVKLEKELDQQGRLSPESLKDFSAAYQHLVENLSKALPSLAASAVEDIKPTVGQLSELASQMSQVYLKGMEEQAPGLAHTDGAELGANPHRLGFIAAIVETSQVFDAAKDLGQPLTPSEKTSMMPAVAEILASNQVLNFFEPQIAGAQRAQPPFEAVENLSNDKQAVAESLER